MRDVHIVRLRHEYQDLAPVAGRFAEMLARELQESLRRSEVPLAVPVEFRVKSWTSIEDKLGRSWFHGASLSELHDLIGIRLILLFRRDVEQACSLVENLCRVLGRRDKSEDLAVEQFGYQSLHLIVKPPLSWLSVPSFSGFHHLEAEIQIRTLAQHMWAAASHELQYKQEEGVPPPVRRAIHRVSALLETVDLEFERVLSERETYRSSVLDTTQEHSLNSDLLEALLDQLFPRRNKEGFESYSLLLWELNKLGITTTTELTNIITRHIDAVLEEDGRSVRQLAERGASDERTKAGVFYSYSGLLRHALELEFGGGYHSRIWEAAEKELRPPKEARSVG